MLCHDAVNYPIPNAKQKLSEDSFKGFEDISSEAINAAQQLIDEELRKCHENPIKIPENVR